MYIVKITPTTFRVIEDITQIAYPYHACHSATVVTENSKN